MRLYHLLISAVICGFLIFGMLALADEQMWGAFLVGLAVSMLRDGDLP